MCHIVNKIQHRQEFSKIQQDLLIYESVFFVLFNYYSIHPFALASGFRVNVGSIFHFYFLQLKLVTSFVPLVSKMGAAKPNSLQKSSR